MKQLNQKGFTLLEITVACAIGFVIMLGLFTAIRTGGVQAIRMDRKHDQVNFINDFRYIIEQPMLCNQRLKVFGVPKDQTEIQFLLGANSYLQKGTTLPIYGLKIDSFRFENPELYRDHQIYEDGEVVYENLGFEMRLVHPLGVPLPKGKLLKQKKHYQVGLTIQASSLGRDSLHFRRDRLSRITLLEEWKRNGKGDATTTLRCIHPHADEVDVAVNFSGLEKHPKNDAFEFTSMGRPFLVRDEMVYYRQEELGSPGGISDPGTDFSFKDAIATLERRLLSLELSGQKDKELFKSQAAQEAGREAFSFPSGEKGGGSSSRSSGSASASGISLSAGTHTGDSGGARNGSTGTTGVRSVSAPNYQGSGSGNRLVNGTRAGSYVNAQLTDENGVVVKTYDSNATDIPEAANKNGSCAINMDAEEALAQGLPTFNHGEYAYMPQGDCMEKRYVCINGTLQDLGTPPKKMTDCNHATKLNSRDVASQISTVVVKQKPKGCAVNVSYEQAIASGRPVFRSGERLKMPSGECLEKSYICYEGAFKDEGYPATAVPGCRKVSGGSP